MAEPISPEESKRIMDERILAENAELRKKLAELHPEELGEEINKAHESLEKAMGFLRRANIIIR
jgi:hypothetical protein